MKRILNSVLTVFLLIAVLFAALVGFYAYRDNIAKAQARRFCETVKPGDATDGLIEKALAAGAQRRMRWSANVQERKFLLVSFLGAPPFSRFICNIDAEKGRVVRVELFHAD